MGEIKKSEVLNNRLDSNLLLVEIMKAYLQQNPDIRFGQALWNLGIIRRENKPDPPPGISWPLVQGIVDPFYEEPWDTLKRLKVN